MLGGAAWVLCALGAPSRATAMDSLRLSVDPMQSGISINLTLRSDGDLQLFEYHRYQLKITSLRSGKLPEAAKLVEESRTFGRKSGASQGCPKVISLHLT